MKITINSKTYDLPNEIVIYINQQQRVISAIESELEKSKHKTVAIECYVTDCKHCHDDLYCKNPHGMSVQVCNYGVPQCEGFENKEGSQ